MRLTFYADGPTELHVSVRLGQKRVEFKTVDEAGEDFGVDLREEQIRVLLPFLVQVLVEMSGPNELETRVHR